MSSKKHFSLSRKPEMFSRHPACHDLLSFFLQLLDGFDSSRSGPVSRGATRPRSFFSIPVVSCAVMTAPSGSLKLVSKVGCRVANHGPIGDSWPIAFLGHARGCELKAVEVTVRRNRSRPDLISHDEYPRSYGGKPTTCLKNSANAARNPNIPLATAERRA